MRRIHFIILLILIVFILSFITITVSGGLSNSSFCSYLGDNYWAKYRNVSYDSPCDIDSDCQFMRTSGPCPHSILVAKSKLDIFNGAQNDLYITFCLNSGRIFCPQYIMAYDRIICENSTCVGKQE